MSWDDDVDILETIGEGGMGVVHRGRQRTLERDVAVKRLKPDATDAAADRLRREAVITGGLEHPNILPIHALGVGDDGRPSVVMKRVSGVSYKALLDDPDHPMWRDLAADRTQAHVDTLSAVCRALELAHSRGVLHRDVKPANIMLGEFGEVFLLDWGLAIHTDEPAATRVVGTPAYMAPEMIEGGPFTAQTDVYLVGATLHHALTGRALHTGESHAALVRKILEGAPPDLAGAPSELAAICRRAVARDPAERFASIRELREAMRDAMAHRASVSLTQTAARNSEVLHQHGVEETTYRRTFDEARFALTEALRIWPDNEEARVLVRVVRAAMFDFEISKENVGAAAALLAELEPPDEDRAARLEALKVELAEKKARTEALERMAADRDPAVGARTRTLALAGYGLAVILITGVMFGFRLNVGYPEMLGLQFAMGLGGAAVLVIVWRPTEHNERSRQLVTLVVGMAIVMLGFTALGWVLALPIVEVLLLESFAMLPGYLIGGLALDRRVAYATPVVLAGIGFGLLVPAHAPLGVAIAQVGGVSAAVLALWWLPVPPALTRS